MIEMEKELVQEMLRFDRFWPRQRLAIISSWDRLEMWQRYAISWSLAIGIPVAALFAVLAAVLSSPVLLVGLVLSMPPAAAWVGILLLKRGQAKDEGRLTELTVAIHLASQDERMKEAQAEAKEREIEEVAEAVTSTVRFLARPLAAGALGVLIGASAAGGYVLGKTLKGAR